MDDFGNIIYVVIAIGWFLSSMYKKAQEKKAEEATARGRRPQQSPVEQTLDRQEQPMTLEDLIRQQFGEEPKRPEPIRVKPVRETFLNAELGEDYQMSKGELVRKRVQRQIKPMEVVEEQRESSMDKWMPNGFDLSQAVVLNAILDRPYK